MSNQQDTTLADYVSDEQHSQSPKNDADQAGQSSTDQVEQPSDSPTGDKAVTESANHSTVDSEGTSDSTLPDDPICPCYEEERSSDEWQAIEGDMDYEPACGHAIAYLKDATGSKIKKSTASVYSGILYGYVDFLRDRDMLPLNADIIHIDQLMKSLARDDYSKPTLKTYRSAIRNMYKHIDVYQDDEPDVDWAHIPEIIDINEYKTAVKIEREPITREELNTLYEALDSFRNRLIVQLAVETAARAVDVAKIRISDVHLDARRITLSNTKADREFERELSEDLTTRLRYWIKSKRLNEPGSENNPYLFPSQMGGHLSKYTLNNIVRSAAERAGIQGTIGESPLSEAQQKAFGTDKRKRTFYRVTFHTLRHTANHLMKEDGVPLEIRSWALDHSDSDTTREFYDQEGEPIECLEERFSGASPPDDF